MKQQNKQQNPGARVKIIPLGGLEQIGMNITAIEYEDNIRQAVKANKNSFSAGLGFSSDGSFFADIAFRATKYANEYIYPYADYILGEDYFPSPEILGRKWMYDVMLTIGFRF